MYYTAAGHKEHIDSIALDIEQFVEELAEAALLNGFIFVRIHFYYFSSVVCIFLYVLLYHIFFVISRKIVKYCINLFYTEHHL